MMRFNINHEVRIRLTDKGRELIAGDDYAKASVRDAEDGWSSVQLWVLMAIFGAHLSNGLGVPFEAEIEIPDAAK